MIREVFSRNLNKKVECLDACQTQLYTLLVANANYATASTYKHTKDFCYVVRKLLRSFENRRQSLIKVQPKLIKLLEKLKVNIVNILE